MNLELPGRKPLLTLRDAWQYITKLPKAEHDAPEWLAAMEACYWSPSTTGRPCSLESELRYIDVGRGGKKRPRIRPDIADLDDFIERRKRTLCLSTNARTPRSTISTSSSKVIGFTARRSAQLAGKPKRSKP